MKPIKVVVVGDPQCGKTVFLGGLYDNLPADGRFLFRACPDGEGFWTYRGKGSQVYRRKGKFTSQMVSWYAKSLARCAMAPIVLVDVGGIPSEENRKILMGGGVQYGIILVRDAEGSQKWRTFLESCGVEVLVDLRSDYHGRYDRVTQVEPVLQGTVHHLDRKDATAFQRPAIRAVAELLIERAEEQNGEHVENGQFINGTTLFLPALARKLEKPLIERRLPGGRILRQFAWEGSDLPKIAELLQQSVEALPETVDIDGDMRAWLAAAFAKLLAPRRVRLNSPDGFVPIGCRRPVGSGKGIEWSRTEIGTIGNDRKLIRVEYFLDPSAPLEPEHLKKIAPPRVERGAVVVVAGRGPHWLTVSIAKAYDKSAAAVACFQPGIGATVAWSQLEALPQGTLIDVL